MLLADLAQRGVGLDPSVERVLELIGIFVFATSGGLVAVRKQFDVVGVTFAAHAHIERRWLGAHLVFDAAGLGLFCVSGTAKALSFGLTGVGAIALGVMTATGGGVVRDVLAHEEPALFRADTILYGIPAALGAAAVTVLWQYDRYSGPLAAVIALCVFTLRIAALQFGWHAPRPRLEDPTG